MKASRRTLLLTLLLLTVLIALTTSPAFAAGPKARFNIEAGEATQTLPQYLQQSGIANALYNPSDVASVSTNAVSGDFEVADALERLLKGTALRSTFSEDYTVLYLSSVEPPGLPEDEDARRAAEALRRSYAGEDVAPSEVVITGTLIRGVLDIMAPLQIVPQSDMRNAAYATVQEVLQSLPVSAATSPGEDSAAPGIFTRGTAANLRGLGPGATLVLVNGRRQPYSGLEGEFVDLSTVPLTAIDRIEVLPDGASALYGSDAIAGVVNIITRSDVEGMETNLRFGSARGGADETSLAHTLGVAWETGKGVVSYQFLKRSSLAASERTYSADADKRALGGSDFRSIRASPGNILDPVTLMPAAGIPPASGDGKSLTLSDLNLSAVNRQNPWAVAELLPEKETHSLFISTAQHLGSRVEVRVDARFNVRDMRQKLFASEQTLLVPNSNPFSVNPFPRFPFTVVGFSFVDVLGPVIGDARVTTAAASVEARARLFDDWDLSFTLSEGREHTSYRAHNFPDARALGSALASSDPTLAFNAFGGSAQNGALIDEIRSVQVSGAKSSVSSASVVASGSLLSVPTGEVKLAVGSEFRREGFAVGVEDRRRFRRSTSAAFAELAVPLMGDPERPRAYPRVDLSLAGRLDRYSDVGSTANPKVALRVSPWSMLKFRSSWSSSFRAPKLIDLYDTSQDLVVLTALTDPYATSGRSLVLARQGRNPDALPESSQTWTHGVDAVPPWWDGASVSLTYFSIDYRDRVVVPGPVSPFDLLLHENEWQDVIARHPTDEAVYALCTSPEYRGPVSQCLAAGIDAVVDFRVRNLARTRVRGVDLELKQHLFSARGWFDVALSGTYLMEFAQSLSPRVPTVDILNSVGNPIALRGRATVDWSQGGPSGPGFGVSCALEYWGGYEDRESLSARSVDSLLTLDLRVAYRTQVASGLLGSLEIALNVANVFARNPPFVDREAGYDVINADPYGRVVSLSLQKGW